MMALGDGDATMGPGDRGSTVSCGERAWTIGSRDCASLAG
jgi:hypothetical protein